MGAPRSAGTRAATALCGLAALLVLTGLALTGLALTGCAPGTDGKSGQGRTYTVRGQIRQLPEPGNPGGGFVVAHEAVDHFVDREGKEVGMDPMTMAFPVDKGVSLAGLQVTDIVEMTLQADWSAEPAVRIVQVRKLPPGTKLDFRAARPGQGR